MVPEFEKDNVCFVVVFCISVYHPFFSSFFFKKFVRAHLVCSAVFVDVNTHRVEWVQFLLFIC